MPEVSCPRSDCEYKTEVVKPILAAALMTAHATIHASGGTSSNMSSARPPPVERPKLQVNLPPDPRSDWEVFCAKWRSFKAARGVEDRQETDSPVTQLHGCMGIWLVFCTANTPLRSRNPTRTGVTESD